MGESMDVLAPPIDDVSGDGLALLQKSNDTDATVNTECSDEQEPLQPGQGSINAFEEDMLPEDDDLHCSVISSFNASSEMNGDAKKEVRKSILKGKSELSRSRQKNNVLKAMPVDGAQSLHRPHVAKNKPPLTRSLSNDDITGATQPGRRLSSSKSLPEGEKPKPRRSMLPPVSGELPQFCTPRRPSGNKVLKVDTTAMLDLATPDVGPPRKTPSRSKSGIGEKKKRHLPRRTSSMDNPHYPGVLHTPRRKPRSFEASQDKSEVASAVDAVTPFEEKDSNKLNRKEGAIMFDVEGEPTQPQPESNSEPAKETGSDEYASAQELTENEQDATDASVSKSARQSTHSQTETFEEGVVLIWSCWACEYESNEADHLFCGMCGTGRDWQCPSCNHDNKSSFNFCGMCGTRKGRSVVHKQQPEGFDMKMHKKKGLPKKLPSSSRSRASKTPESAGIGKSSNRRASGRHKLIPDEAALDEHSAASDRQSHARSTTSGDHAEKRRSRGRDGKKPTKGGESRTRGDSITRKKMEHSRSGSGFGRDGKERRRRDSVAGEDDLRPRKEKPQKRKTRLSASLSDEYEEKPAERHWSGLEEDSWDAFEAESSRNSPIKTPSPPSSHLSTASPPNLQRSASESKQESEDNMKGMECNTGDAGGKLNIDALATPSIKKRLLKIGKGAGKMLFNKAEGDLIIDEAPNEQRFAEVKINRSQSGEMLDSQHVPKKSLEPPTPSLKKRLLGKVGWSKSEHQEKGPSPPMLTSETCLVDDSDSEDQNVDAEDDDDMAFDPLAGLSQGLVVTAKDMRPNRPQTSRRKPQNIQRRRPNRDDVQTDRNRSRSKSSDRVMRKEGGRPSRHKGSDSGRRHHVGGSSEIDDPATALDISEADSIDSQNY